MIMRILRNTLRIIYLNVRGWKYDRFYRRILQINGYPNIPVKGEEEWREKWSQFGYKAKVSHYRVFSHYLGANINIVPEDICHDFIEPILNPNQYIGYYSDKNVFDKLFPKGYFPRTLLRKMNGLYYDCDYNQIHIEGTQLKSFLNNAQRDKIIIKPSIDGQSGIGINIFKLENEGNWLNMKTNDLLDVNYLDKYGSNFIIQEVIDQHEYIGMFNSTSVNTLRLSLYRSVKTEECHITGAIMRIGKRGSVVDNAHAGGAYVGIHEDGIFCNEVLDQYGRKQTIFNDIDFSKEFKYPYWEDVLSFAKTVGKFVPHHRLLALDIVLTSEGKPLLLEYNIRSYSSWLFQYTVSSAFGKFTDEILAYCKKNQDLIKYSLVI